MEAIVAVYEDWGIGAEGTQPIALSADRRFFREITKGACVIVGRRTLEDFPGGKPLPNRVNLVLTGKDMKIPGATVIHTPVEAVKKAGEFERAMVIGGASVYNQMLPHCNKVYVTKIAACPKSDVFFSNLDADPVWKQTKVLGEGEEDGIAYRFCLYERI